MTPIPVSSEKVEERYRLVPEDQAENHQLSICCLRSFSHSPILPVVCRIDVEREGEDVISYVSVDSPLNFNDDGYAISNTTIVETSSEYERDVDGERCTVRLSLELHRGDRTERESYVIGLGEVYGEDGRLIESRYGDFIDDPFCISL